MQLVSMASRTSTRCSGALLPVLARSKLLLGRRHSIRTITPLSIYRAPRMTYEPTSLPRDRLIDLLHRVNIEPRELIAPTHEEQFDARLSAYWSARNRFIEAGRDVRPSSDVQQMLTQVRAPLLEVLQISRDFRPAYDPLLQMAQALMTIDSDAAQELLDDLQRIQPERSEASQILLGSQRARSSVSSKP